MGTSAHPYIYTPLHLHTVMVSKGLCRWN